MAQNKKSWSDLSPRQRQLAVVAAVVEAVVTAAALRDLGRRSAEEVRGPKMLWRMSFAVQPFGPLTYFVLGRRSDD